MIEKRTILVRYDEIGLKGRNRKYFIKVLLKNIKRSLPAERGIEYRIPRGRILIDLPKSVADEIGDQLKMIPGIASYSIGISVNPDFDEMAGLGVKWIEPLLKSKGKEPGDQPKPFRRHPQKLILKSVLELCLNSKRRALWWI